MSALDKNIQNAMQQQAQTARAPGHLRRAILQIPQKTAQPRFFQRRIVKVGALAASLVVGVFVLDIFTPASADQFDVNSLDPAGIFVNVYEPLN